MHKAVADERCDAWFCFWFGRVQRRVECKVSDVKSTAKVNSAVHHVMELGERQVFEK